MTRNQERAAAAESSERSASMTRSRRPVKPTVQHTFDPGAFRDTGGRESAAGLRRLHPATVTTATTSQGLRSGSPSLLRCLVIIA